MKKKVFYCGLSLFGRWYKTAAHANIKKEDYKDDRILVHVHKKGWMDKNGLQLWIIKMWEQGPGGLVKPNACLIYDMFKGHLVDRSRIN